MMREEIRSFIEQFTENYQKRDHIAARFGRPLVGFADACHPYIQGLRDLIGPTHQLPQDVLPDARIVIAYFVPFTRELAESNRDGLLASPQWARTYEETNAMFGELNQALADLIRGQHSLAGVAPGAAAFDQQNLVSDWSHRHIAYAAGLGTFGLNNMLLTRRGCCGRYSTVVTNLALEPDAPVEGEYCLFKKNGSCGICARHCPAGALTTEDYDRFKCYALCLENAKIYTQFGSSYTGSGSEVCGKCVTDSPCAFWDLNL